MNLDLDEYGVYAFVFVGQRLVSGWMDDWMDE